MLLKFSRENAKTKALYDVSELKPYLSPKRGKSGRKTSKVYSIDLSAGISCPGAAACKSQANESAPGVFTILDGPDCEFRCFSASQEVTFPPARKARRHNFDLLRQAAKSETCYDLLVASLPDDIGVLRYHVSGDFFTPNYLMAAIELATRRPDVLFYAYTKSLHFIERHFPMQYPEEGVMRDNFLITASRGGRYDHLIEPLKMREAVVFTKLADADASGLDIDHDDSHAATMGGSFGLLLHGTQPAGSEAAKDLRALKGAGNYARK